MRLPFVGPSYESSSKSISAHKTVNAYIEIDGDRAGLVGIPGRVEFSDLGAPVRALKRCFGKLYAVAGGSAFCIGSNGVATNLGSVSDDGKPADIEQNIFEVLFLSGGSGSVAQKNATELTAITDTDFPVSKVCQFIDGYGLLLESGSGRFRFTSINDFETISGIDFATAEGSPDDLVSLVVDHREVWLFGEDSTEVWYNVGDANNPFQRSPGGFIERGCRGAFSPAKMDNTVIWLGDDNVVYRADGLTPIRISNHGIEKDIRATQSEPVSYTYNDRGHAFYVLNFPGELTVVYDASTQTWHHRETRERSDYAAHHHAYCYGENYVGGPDGKIYKLDADTYLDAGDELVRSRTIGPLRSDGYFDIAQLTCLFETGENESFDPLKVFLEISQDGGKSFQPRIEGDIGAQGQYQRLCDFLYLGGYEDNQLVMRLTMTDNAKFSLVDAYAR